VLYKRGWVSGLMSFISLFTKIGGETSLVKIERKNGTRNQQARESSKKSKLCFSNLLSTRNMKLGHFRLDTWRLLLDMLEEAVGHQLEWRHD